VHDPGPEDRPSAALHRGPGAKSTKNRLHLDLRPRSKSRDEEVDWLLSIGATQVADLRGKYGPGSGWVVFADPEGNEFCMLSSDAEREAVADPTRDQTPEPAQG